MSQDGGLHRDLSQVRYNGQILSITTFFLELAEFLSLLFLFRIQWATYKILPFCSSKEPLIFEPARLLIHEIFSWEDPCTVRLGKFDVCFVGSRGSAHSRDDCSQMTHQVIVGMDSRIGASQQSGISSIPKG